MYDRMRVSTVAADAPVVGWATGPLAAVQAADREIARATALRARAVAAFAALRPASVDRAQGERGAMSAERWAARADVLRPVSEWATPELAVALNLTQQGAEGLLEESLILVHRLPAVLDALEAGVVHRGHLWHLIDKVAPIDEPELRAEVAAELLAWVAQRNRVTSPAQLGDKARKLVAQRDATAAARRLAKALKERGISIRPERAEGMACVSVVCTMPEAKALYAALVEYAEALVDDPAGPVRTRGQKMVDALLDLVLRPGETDLPPVQVLLSVVASVSTMLGGDAPGEVDGELVPAEMVRQLVRAFAGHGLIDGGAQADSADHAGPAAPAIDTNFDTGTGTGTGAGVDAPAADVGADRSRGWPLGTVGGEPVDAVGGPIDRAEAALSAPEFDQWLDELVRRGFGDSPTPGDPGWLPGEPPDPGEWDPGAWEELEDLDEPEEPVDDPSPLLDSGWWAAADRAVDDAGAAVHAARLALGHAQRSVRTAQRAAAAEEAAWQASPAGRVDAATDALAALAAAADTQREDLADLLAATAGGGLADRPRIVLADAITGAFGTLTDLPGLRRAAHCGKSACRRRPETCSHDLTGRPGLRAATATDG
ncbi:MAG TPA: HNH endonuclease, partial [Geodermatophilus sp.]|nr:HNH endonuclease [Geodermatophilus sp.]